MGKSNLCGKKQFVRGKVTDVWEKETDAWEN